jgi:hypothetical protein
LIVFRGQIMERDPLGSRLAKLIHLIHLKRGTWTRQFKVANEWQLQLIYVILLRKYSLHLSFLQFLRRVQLC